MGTLSREALAGHRDTFLFLWEKHKANTFFFFFLRGVGSKNKNIN